MIPQVPSEVPSLSPSSSLSVQPSLASVSLSPSEEPSTTASVRFWKQRSWHPYFFHLSHSMSFFPFRWIARYFFARPPPPRTTNFIRRRRRGIRRRKTERTDRHTRWLWSIGMLASCGIVTMIVLYPLSPQERRRELFFPGTD